MERLSIKPRIDWQRRVESVGLTFHTIDDQPYWDESACYRFTRHQIDVLDDATNELQRLCLAAVEEVIRRDWFDRLHIPRWSVPYICDSWQRGDASVYGRFDLAWDGTGSPKLLEYNADTPTSLLESAIVQWFWLTDCFPEADQFNQIHERLIAFWQDFSRHHPRVHFASVADSPEDFGNVEYLRDTAIQAGMDTHWLAIDDIGWDAYRRRFVDKDDRVLQTLFKLYPWEWLLREPFAPYLSYAHMAVLEPPWKQILSNKGILPILWELFEDHLNLLPARFDADELSGDYVRKPLYSREGANIEIHRRGEIISSGGQYGDGPCIIQRDAPLPDFDGHHPVIGSWVIANQAAGIGIREDTSDITGNNSRFIPHYFVEDSA